MIHRHTTWTVIVAVALVSLGCSADPTWADVTFSDNVFNDVDWDLTVFTNNSGTQTASQQGTFRLIVDRIPDALSPDTAGVNVGIHMRSGAVYTPQDDGPIGSIDYSQWDTLLDSEGTGEASALALRQGGHVYLGAFHVTGGPGDGWTQYQKTGLRAKGFSLLLPVPDWGPSVYSYVLDPTQHPDFSAVGSIIEFGFARSGTTSFGGPGATVTTGAAHWSVTIRTVAPIYITDGIFNDSNWTAQKILDTTPAGNVTFAAAQVLTGGNPDEYRRTTHDYIGPGSMVVAHISKVYSYVPAAQGPISTIDFSLDVNLFFCVPGVSDSVAYGLLLVQNGYYYGAGYDLVTTDYSDDYPLGKWIRFDKNPSVTAADFYFFGQSQPPQPPLDFSETGALIQFGYWTSNGTGGTLPGHTEHGIDNWSVTVHSP